tara:strand:+ start:351 stop:518 length:168 start_codon:yes stop_codon:yes gene_type:complete
MARIKITRFPLPQKEFTREQQDLLIRELEAVINQLNFSYQSDIKDEVNARSWFGV